MDWARSANLDSVLIEFSDHLMLVEAPNEVRTLAVIAAARDRGPSILDDGIAKMRLGLTTAQEVARAIHDGAPPQPSISLAASQEDE